MSTVSPKIRNILRLIAALALLAGLLAGALPLALAQSPAGDVEAVLANAFPGAQIVMPTPESAVGTVMRDGRPEARFGSSFRIAGSVGYSGHPVDVLVAVDNDGIVRLARLLGQEEPILTIGVGPDALDSYVAGFVGLDVRQPVRELQRDGTMPDGVSGATISSGVIRDAILRTGRMLLGEGAANAPVASKTDAAPDWGALVASGAVRLLDVTFARARAAMPEVGTLPEGDGLFVRMAVARLDKELATALVGASRYGRLSTGFAADDVVFLIASQGVYSVKGTAWRRSGTFERLEFVTASGVVNPPSASHVRLDGIVADGAPQFREAMLVAIPASAGDVTAVDLVVDKTAEGAAKPARFRLDLAAAPPSQADPQVVIADELLWLENWRAATPQLSILTVMLGVLFVALYISGPIVRRPQLYAWFRIGFLSVTLVWLGWIAGAQLSIVQAIAFVQSLLTGFRWDVFLLAPLIFVLWAFLALGVLFWGRGVYCGWLCPFGALQELLHKAGQRFGVRRIEIPWEVHERLWPLKYIALLAIVGLSLNDTASGFAAAEIEPFKTAVILHFARDWPYVVYAVALLAAGLFVERAYCRYLCPLGAALALPSKFKIFDWLIRRPQCGRECRLCATTCTVQAIDPIGRINANECIYCLKCQVNYHDPQTCVPLKMRAKRREGASPAPGAGQPRPQLVRRAEAGGEPKGDAL